MSPLLGPSADVALCMIELTSHPCTCASGPTASSYVFAYHVSSSIADGALGGAQVDEATGDDNSVATMNPTTLETLGLFRGDTIIVRGKKRKDTVLIVLMSEDVDEGKIQMNKGAHLPILSSPTYTWTGAEEDVGVRHSRAQ